MSQPEQVMPALLQELHTLEFNYTGGEGIDFEPYSEFLSEEKTRTWIRAWTGNKELKGTEYRVFGQDGTGGYAAFWLVRPGDDILGQPIVFFGSEGGVGIVAANFNDYLWLLAGGVGPVEAILFPGLNRRPDPVFTVFAQRHSSTPRLGPWEVIAKAQTEFPSFAQEIQAACR
jgi:hypothetical protein